ncbi:peptidoglycan DD-metalloendopeptidase family protein [Streptomyces sclerotialus]|uniref:peptidoglycan DD-metalloendopeptidase family protein n=1 Tax=Streptomyces sclerotialus TaxID=1957 RepID=UPI0004CC7DC2
MVAPAVLSAAAKAAKVAKAAKQAGRSAGGNGNDEEEKKKRRRRLLIIIAALSSGSAWPWAVGGLVIVILLASLFGNVGGAATAACGDYAENANNGNTSPAAATKPIMPSGSMYAPSMAARYEVPPRMILASMRAAARYKSLDWTIIAGQMYQETKFGQDKSAAPGGDNGHGYSGILQFGDAAWKDYGADGNGDGKKDRYNVDDAAFATANYLHAKHAESDAYEALRHYSGSQRTNTIYMRVVLTQAERYRGELLSDKKLIKRWYEHLAETVKRNPSFPTLGQQSDIPEPVNNNVQISDASTIKASPRKKWSTPPLEDEEQVRAAAPDSDAGNEAATSTTPFGSRSATSLSMATVAHSRPVAAPMAPRAPAEPKGEAGKNWQWPLKKGTYQIGTKYRETGNNWSLGYHTGLDFKAGTGTPIYAPADGTVTKAGAGGSYGNETDIKHANGVVTLYAHQSQILVSAGDRVKRGQLIGKVGATGNVTGPHLHWEVRMPGVDNPFVAGHDAGPGMVDPEDWMQGKITASPDYGSVPDGQGGKQEQVSTDEAYQQCATQAKGPKVEPDGAGETGVMPSADNPVVRAALGWAQRGIGTPYVLGAPRLAGDDPSSFDCSSFVQWAYYQASGKKIDITGTTYSQEPHLRKYKISLSEAQPGDLIYFNPSGRGSEHVAMVWDPKDHKIIHAPRPGKNVEFSTWDVQDKITNVYRVPIPKGTDPVEADGGDQHKEA